MTESITKPCPFCGSHDISDGEILASEPTGTPYVQSECQGCGAIGPKGFLNDGEVDYGDVKAIAAWNTRTELGKDAAAQAEPVAWPTVDVLAKQIARDTYTNATVAESKWMDFRANAQDALEALKKLYTTPPPSPIIGGEVTDAAFKPGKLKVIIDEFIDGYEMYGEDAAGRDGTYTPNDHERYLIKDAIMGLLADPDWDAEWGKHIDRLAATKPDAKDAHLAAEIRPSRQWATLYETSDARGDDCPQCKSNRTPNFNRRGYYMTNQSDAERLAFEALPSEIQQAVVTLRAVSEWLESSVNYGSSSPDEPPQPNSEFDYRLSQAAVEISGVANRIQAARNPGAGRVVPIEPNESVLLYLMGGLVEPQDTDEFQDEITQEEADAINNRCRADARIQYAEILNIATKDAA